MGRKKLRKKVKFNNEFKVYYSELGLVKLHDLYEKNFKKMVKFPGNKQYIKIENKLNRLETKIRKSLNYTMFLCPKNENIDCKLCDGYIYKGNNRHKCALFEYSMNGNKKISNTTLSDLFSYKPLTKDNVYGIVNFIDDDKNEVYDKMEDKEL